MNGELCERCTNGVQSGSPPIRRSVYCDCPLGRLLAAIDRCGEQPPDGIAVKDVQAMAVAMHRQLVGLDVWARNLAKGVVCRYSEGGPEALKHVPEWESLRFIEKRIAHLGRLQHLYCEDVGGARGQRDVWRARFHRAMKLLSPAVSALQTSRAILRAVVCTRHNHPIDASCAGCSGMFAPDADRQVFAALGEDPDAHPAHPRRPRDGVLLHDAVIPPAPERA